MWLLVTSAPFYAFYILLSFLRHLICSFRFLPIWITLTGLSSYQNTVNYLFLYNLRCRLAFVLRTVEQLLSLLWIRGEAPFWPKNIVYLRFSVRGKYGFVKSLIPCFLWPSHKARYNFAYRTSKQSTVNNIHYLGWCFFPFLASWPQNKVISRSVRK